MTKIEELRAAYEAARDSDSTGECHQYEDEFLAVAFHAMPALLEAVEALEKMKTSFEDLLNGYPERELHEPYQVTLNRANNLLEKLN